ncbi:hypothetical protein QSH14_01845 [Proteus faecis]|uniref:Tail spike TSP1/Gp66 N-terminal domain-containing protein n=2 Tax=Proteus TaxID=583 RepID=A0AAW7CVG1_9GAMM|nr:hypothetical protein [Proteus faecis]MDL5165830.1 hypothetical protein [Proteus faecis]MDL5273906.1 hypothetical protein [Proteus faecis]MDL5277476.1 hypothetical protein [Proteus faecis]MDL5306465.1 hypothetical protein [Proteus faecis]MDL5310033.1 hypothetical protein [Proteus faecis]
MSTIPTQNPVPSETAKDLKFNSGKIDEFVTSMKNKYIDRFGQEHFTIEGLRWVAQQAISQFGYITLDSFQKGAEITLPNQVLRDEVTGEYYRWDGDLPKSVPVNSTPDNSDGVGVGKWLSVGDASLRNDLERSSGADFIAGGILTRYKKKGSFQNGGTVNNANEALSYSDGFYYINITGSYPVTVDPNSSPNSGWLCVGLLEYFPANYALNFSISENGDMTDNVRKLHAYCNYSGEEAVYYGVKSFSVDSTAEIIISTDVNFNGADVLFIQSELRPEWEFIPAFRVLDPLTPLETIPNDWEPGTLYADRTTIKNNSYEFSEGVICFDTNINFGKRYPTDSVYYKLREVFKVFKGGILNYPIDISIAGGDLGSVLFRKQPNKYLTIKDINIDSSNAPQLQAFSIERNKCNLVGFDFKNNTSVNKSRTIVYLNKVCDIHLSKWSGSGFEGNSASYLLGGDFVANMSITDFGIDGGMPAIGMNVVNGVDVENSHINRFDVHSFLHNVFIDNVTFGVYGVTYGVGGGTLSVKNSTFIKGKVPGRGDFVSLNEFSLITARGDYGGVFYGVLQLSNIAIRLDLSIDLSGGNSTHPYRISAIRFIGSGDFGFYDRKPWAYNISVSDITVEQPSYSFYFDFMVLDFGGGLSSGSLFPDYIKIKNIRFLRSPEAKHQIIPIKFPPYEITYCRSSHNKINGNSNIIISNIKSICSRFRITERMSIGLSPDTSEQTKENRLIPRIEINDSEGISLFYSVNGSIVTIENSEIRDFRTRVEKESSPDITFTGCRFYFVDGSQSQVSNCKVFNSQFNRHSSNTGMIQFGGILASQGNTIRPGVTLANGGNTGITVNSIFMGYLA